MSEFVVIISNTRLFTLLFPLVNIPLNTALSNVLETHEVIRHQAGNCELPVQV